MGPLKVNVDILSKWASKLSWVEAFSIVVFLINRLPTKILNNRSPWECLFNRPPDYNFLRRFGCVCFPWLRPYNKHKLEFMSRPCVFIGYSLNHLGYRCLDLDIGYVFLSRHVIFNEQVFPFKNVWSTTLASAQESTNPMFLLCQQPVMSTSPISQATVVPHSQTCVSDLVEIPAQAVGSNVAAQCTVQLPQCATTTTHHQIPAPPTVQQMTFSPLVTMQSTAK